MNSKDKNSKNYSYLTKKTHNQLPVELESNSYKSKKPSPISVEISYDKRQGSKTIEEPQQDNKSSDATIEQKTQWNYFLTDSLQQLYSLLESKTEQEANHIKESFLQIIPAYTGKTMENGELYLEFGKDITLSEYMNLVYSVLRKLIVEFSFNHDNLTVKDQLQINYANLSSFLFELKQIQNLNFMGNTPLSIAKRDYLLGKIASSRVEKNPNVLIFKQKDSDYQNYFTYYSKQRLGLSTLRRKSDIPVYGEFNLYNLKDISKVINSKPIRQLYKKVFDILKIPTDDNDIDNHLTEILKYLKVYAITMDPYGITIYNKTIFLQSEMVYHSLRNYSYSALVLITLFHEIGHILNRLIRESNNNYLLTDNVIYNSNNMEYTLEKDKNKKLEQYESIIDDFGDLFEHLLYFSTNSKSIFNYHAGKFLLEQKNYNLDMDLFIKTLDSKIKQTNPQEYSRDLCAFKNCIHGGMITCSTLGR